MINNKIYPKWHSNVIIITHLVLKNTATIIKQMSTFKDNYKNGVYFFMSRNLKQ